MTPENPMFDAMMLDIFLTQAELQPILSLNNIGWLPWQQRSVWGKFEKTVKLHSPENPLLGVLICIAPLV